MNLTRPDDELYRAIADTLRSDYHIPAIAHIDAIIVIITRKTFKQEGLIESFTCRFMNGKFSIYHGNSMPRERDHPLSSLDMADPKFFEKISSFFKKWHE